MFLNFSNTNIIELTHSSAPAHGLVRAGSRLHMYSSAAATLSPHAAAVNKSIFITITNANASPTTIATDSNTVPECQSLQSNTVQETSIQETSDYFWNVRV